MFSIKKVKKVDRYFFFSLGANNMTSNDAMTLKIRLIAHIETWRPYTVIWCGLLSFSGALLTYKGIPPIHLSLFSLFIPIFGWIAGLYLADYLDRSLDKIQKEHRPIPSGRIKPIEALFIGGLFVLTGTILTALFRIENFLFIPLSGILVFTYAKYTKSKSFLGNINRGLLALTSFYFGVSAISFTLGEIPSYIWPISLVFLIHDMNTNLVGTFRDIEGDKKAGYLTIPVKYGIKPALIFSSILTILWLFLTLLFSIIYQVNNFYFFIIILIDIILLSIILFRSKQLYRRYSREKSLDIHKLFILERITLASAFIFIFASLQFAIFLYGLCLMLSAIFQFILRNQYEFNKWTL